MTLRPPTLLTSTQREQFTRFPVLDERTLARYYLLSEDDLRLIRERRRDFNKLGYAVQLTVLRHLGRALRLGEMPPEEVLAYLAEQLRVDPACYHQYAAREPTRYEHFTALCQHLGYVELSRRLNHELRDWLVPLAMITDQPFGLMSALMDELRRRCILVPRFSVLERLVHSARVRADQHAYSLLNLPLKGDLSERVDVLLSPQGDEPISRFAWLGRPVGAPKPKNGLALALRELGRVQRTLFTLEWLSDPELRRRVLAGLNKGEALHALKQAVAFHRSGEIRDRSFEAQSNRASGLNLVTTAIAVWNTVYLGRAVEALRAEGVDVPDELLAHISPLSWEHIGLTGDYVWRPEGVPAKGAYRALRE